MRADGDPYLGGEAPIVCHNDCAAWNLVMGDDRWAFIDWDVAGPRPRLWDVAYAIRGMVLVEPDGADRDRVSMFATRTVWTWSSAAGCRRSSLLGSSRASP